MPEREDKYLIQLPSWAKAISGDLYPPESYVLEPKMHHILAGEKLRGKEVLDVGTGYGRFAAYMKNLGAVVLGIDLDEEMVHRASKNIKCWRGDIQDIPFRDGKFDFVLCSLVLMAPTVPDYKRAFAEMWRILRAGGTLVYSIVHPCFESWGVNGEFPFKKAQDYFSESIKKWPLRLINGTILELEYFHRPLENYFLSMEGLFSIKGFWEPRCTDSQVFDRYWNKGHYAEVEYLIVKAIKDY